MCLPLKEESETEDGQLHVADRGEGEVGSRRISTQTSTNCRLVDASIQKNISFDGKPVTPTSWNGGFTEIFSLRDQLKQAEERALQVQKEVRLVLLHTRLLRPTQRIQQRENPPAAHEA